LKTVEPQGSGGSNPPPSATHKWLVQAKLVTLTALIKEDSKQHLQRFCKRGVNIFRVVQ